MSDSVKYLQQKEILKKSRSNIITWNNLIIRNSFSFFLVFSTKNLWGFPGGSDSKESDCNAGDTGSIPGSGRSPREGNGYALQYSFFFFFHSSILAWRIPWTEKPGRLQSIGSQRIGHN